MMRKIYYLSTIYLAFLTFLIKEFLTVRVYQTELVSPAEGIQVNRMAFFEAYLVTVDSSFHYSKKLFSLLKEMVLGFATVVVRS